MTSQETVKKSAFTFVTGYLTGLLALVLLIWAVAATLGVGYHLSADFNGTASTGYQAFRMILGQSFPVIAEDGTASTLQFAHLMSWSLACLIMIVLGLALTLVAYVLSLFPAFREKVGGLEVFGGAIAFIGGLIFLLVAKKELAFQIDGGAGVATAVSLQTLATCLTVGKGFTSVGPLAIFGGLLAIVTASLNKETWADLVYKYKNFFAPVGIQKDMMRYSDNSISSTFGYIGILTMAAGFCFMYSTTAVTGVKNTIFGLGNNGLWVGIDVFLNIILLLFLFLAITSMKAYSRDWGIVSICFGGVMLLRPWFYPLNMMNYGILTKGNFLIVMILYLVSGVSLATAGIVSILRGKTLRNYLATVGEHIEGEKGGIH